MLVNRFYNIKGKLIDFGDSLYYNLLQKELKDCSSVLDLGCGENSPLMRCKKIRYSVGVDIFKESINKSKKKKIHNEYKLMNINLWI